MNHDVHYSVGVGVGWFTLMSYLMCCVIVELCDSSNWIMDANSVGSNFMLVILGLFLGKFWWASVRYTYKSWLLN